MRRGNTVIGLKRSNFPVFSRVTGKSPNGDRFAEDCLHRHAVRRFHKEILLSGISAEVPRLTPATVAASDLRERSLENGGAVGVANSPFGNLAVRLVTKKRDV